MAGGDGITTFHTHGTLEYGYFDLFQDRLAKRWAGTGHLTGLIDQLLNLPVEIVSRRATVINPV